MWYRLNSAVFGWYFRLAFGYQIEGREHEPKPPFIVIANHASAVDIPLVTRAVRAPVRFAAKVELSDHPLVKLWIRSVGSFFVRRGQMDRQAIRTGLEILRRGGVLGLFPEGRRSSDGRIQPFEDGAAYWALKAGVPVLPMGIIGSHLVMPVGAKKLLRHLVLVRIGAPLAVPRVDGRLTAEVIRAWTQRFRAAVSALLPPEQQPLPEAAALAYNQRSRPR